MYKRTLKYSYAAIFIAKINPKDIITKLYNNLYVRIRYFQYQKWRHSSVAEYLRSMYKDLGSISSTANKENTKTDIT